MRTPWLAVTVERAQDGAVVVGLADGGLGVATALHLELEELAAAGTRRFVVDIGAALPLDLTVVGVLLASLRRLHGAGGRLVLLAPEDEALVSDDSIRLDTHFEVEATMPAALAAAVRGTDR